LLKDAARGETVDLPNTDSVLPFLNLYSLVVLLPNQLIRNGIGAAYTPDLWVFKKGRFSRAPERTPPGGTGVSRIYDVLANPNRHPGSDKSPNRIPLSPAHRDFPHQRYWRLPVLGEPGAMLMVFLEWTRWLTVDCDEVNHARDIEVILRQTRNARESVSRPLAQERKRTLEDQDNDQRSRKLPCTRQRVTTECKSKQGIKRPLTRRFVRSMVLVFVPGSDCKFECSSLHELPARACPYHWSLY